MRRDLKTSTRVASVLLSRRVLDVTAPEVAFRLAMSESTMRRALREEGTSYQRIVDAVRVHRLKQLKREGKLTSGKAIAGDLGFAGKNSFFKFVKTKVGQTYTEFRKAA